jgi:hypothetical protein
MHRQGRMHGDGAQVGVHAEQRTKGEQPGLGFEVARSRIERRIAYRTQEHRIGTRDRVAGFSRQGIAAVLHASSADRVVGCDDVNPEALRRGSQHSLSLGCYLGADPVARKDRNVHDVSVPGGGAVEPDAARTPGSPAPA